MNDSIYPQMVFHKHQTPKYRIFSGVPKSEKFKNLIKKGNRNSLNKLEFKNELKCKKYSLLGSKDQFITLQKPSVCNSERTTISENDNFLHPKNKLKRLITGNHAFSLKNKQSIIRLKTASKFTQQSENSLEEKSYFMKNSLFKTFSPKKQQFNPKKQNFFLLKNQGLNSQKKRTFKFDNLTKPQSLDCYRESFLDKLKIIKNDKEIKFRAGLFSAKRSLQSKFENEPFQGFSENMHKIDVGIVKLLNNKKFTNFIEKRIKNVRRLYSGITEKLNCSIDPVGFGIVEALKKENKKEEGFFYRKNLFKT